MLACKTGRALATTTGIYKDSHCMQNCAGEAGTAYLIEGGQEVFHGRLSSRANSTAACLNCG